MNKCQVAIQSVIPAISDSAKVFEPGEEAFYFPAASVAAEFASILADVDSVTFVR